MNTKLHAVCDSQGRPLNLFVTAGQVSDDIGARALLGNLPDVDWLLGDRGYDADWFREALKDKGIRPCISGREQRKKTVEFPLGTLLPQFPAGRWTSADTTTQPHRDHVRQTEGLAMRGNPIRQMPKGLPFDNRTRRNRHLLAMRSDSKCQIYHGKIERFGAV